MRVKLAKVIRIYGLLVCMAILLNHEYRKASDIIVSELHVTYFHLFTLTDIVNDHVLQWRV